MRKTCCSFSILPDQRANQKEWFTPLEAIWFIPTTPSALFFNTRKIKSTGAQPTSDGSPVTLIYCMARYQQVQQPLCSRVFLRGRTGEDSGRWLNDTK